MQGPWPGTVAQRTEFLNPSHPEACFHICKIRKWSELAQVVWKALWSSWTHAFIYYCADKYLLRQHRAVVKAKDFGLWQTRVGILALLPASCVTIDKSPNLSEHQLPPLQITTNNST